VDLVIEALVQRHAFGNLIDAAFLVVIALSELGNYISRLGVFLVLILNLEHRLGAFVGVYLANHDLARGGHLIDFKGGGQLVIGVWIHPVVQCAVGPGFAQFASRVFGVFGF